MALITNTTVTITKRTTLPDGSIRTETATEIDSERTARYARIWMETAYQYRVWTQGLRETCWSLAALSVAAVTIWFLAFCNWPLADTARAGIKATLRATFN